jgi:hypothetical protein
MARAAACGTIDRNLQKPAPAGCPPRRLAPRQRIDVLLARPPGLAYRAFVCAGPRNCGCGPASPGRQRKPDGARRYVARRPRETATYSPRQMPGSRMEAGTTPRGKPPLYGREARADRARDCRRRCVPRGTPDAPFYRRVAPVFKAGAQMKRRRRFRKRNRQRLASHRRRLGR